MESPLWQRHWTMEAATETQPKPYIKIWTLHRALDSNNSTRPDNYLEVTIKLRWKISSTRSRLGERRLDVTSPRRGAVSTEQLRGQQRASPRGWESQGSEPPEAVSPARRFFIPRQRSSVVAPVISSAGSVRLSCKAASFPVRLWLTNWLIRDHDSDSRSWLIGGITFTRLNQLIKECEQC